MSKCNITAIIYDRKGRVLSIGKNSYLKSHPLQARHAHKCGESDKIFLHGEIAAIVRCKTLEKAHRIDVFRFDSNGLPVNSKPCKICQSAIKEAGIKIINHT